MIKSQIYGIVVGGLVVLAGSSVLTAVLSPTPNASFHDSSAILVAAGSVAVGIERAIEAFWTVMGQLKSTYWPLSVPDRALDALIGDLNQKLEPFFQQADSAVGQVALTNNWSSEQLANAKGNLASIEREVAALQGGVAENREVATTSAAVARQITLLQNQYPALAPVAANARDTVTAIAAFAATFRDNPGRRLISLFVGAVLGLGVAGISGMDIVHAAAGTAPGAGWHWGVVVTGIAIGLGSSPTHELIRSVQEYKQTQKSASTSA